MRGLPLSRLAASLLVAGGVVLTMAANGPGHASDAKPPSATAGDGTKCDDASGTAGDCPSEAASGAGDAADTAAADVPSANRNGGDAGYWTEERMRAATPLPTPQITDEEYRQLFGDKKKSD
jgi:hypothetical protein